VTFDSQIIDQDDIVEHDHDRLSLLEEEARIQSPICNTNLSIDATVVDMKHNTHHHQVSHFDATITTEMTDDNRSMMNNRKHHRSVMNGVLYDE
jgi:hypothetical protein